VGWLCTVKNRNCEKLQSYKRNSDVRSFYEINSDYYFFNLIPSERMPRSRLVPHLHACLMQTSSMESIGFHHGDSQAPVSDLLMAHGGAGNNLDDWRYEMRREIQEILVRNTVDRYRNGIQYQNDFIPYAVAIALTDV